MDANNLWPPPREIAYLHSATLTTADPAFRAAVADVVKRLGTQQVEIATPSQDRQLVSTDAHSALVVASLTGGSADQVRNTILAAAPAHPGVTIEETGDITASDARDRSTNSDLKRAELLSVPVTLNAFAWGCVIVGLGVFLLGVVQFRFRRR